MFARPLSLRISASVAAAVLCSARVSAQLTAVNPFQPTQSAAPAGAPTPGAPLEYRGMLEDSAGPLYRIVDPAGKKGAYVRLNERDDTLGVVVKKHEVSGDNDSVVVEQGGRTFTLPLRSAKVVSSGAAGNLAPPPPAPMPAMATVPPAVTNAVVVNPTPADEQKRLEAVAAEVARRRALREQATQQVGQAQPMMPQPAPLPQPQSVPPTNPRAAPPGQRPR